jgi:ethanolamine ammonia-lyase small subunit
VLLDEFKLRQKQFATFLYEHSLSQDGVAKKVPCREWKKALLRLSVKGVPEGSLI